MYLINIFCHSKLKSKVYFFIIAYVMINNILRNMYYLKKTGNIGQGFFYKKISTLTF